MSADRPDHVQDPSWLTLDEAGQRLGLSRDALRKRIARGRLEARLGNDGTTRVLVTSATVPDGAGQSTDSPDVVRLTIQLDAALERLESVTQELIEARERAARAEGTAEALSGRVQDMAVTLSAALAKAEARADRLEAALAEARRPWLARVLEGLRRKG